ncbi:contractile injection system tape measure protein [Mucilaginibacter sp. 22184]|uniref:contractile injection system tape measure protein n=1 Tax=Mucilaginibacter sp. 22184 TaxID=3453887 RepID=UPI003F869F43
MASHIVHRQQVTLNIPKREEALAFQNRVSDLLRNELSASMEAIFDELFPTTDIIRIDSLLLDLGNIEAHNFEQEFKKHFIEKLRKSIPAIKNDLADEHSEQILKPEQSLAKAFIYFLENGYLPWYSPVENMAAWSNEIIAIFSDTEKIALYFFDWFRDKHVDNPVILQRLVLQFDNSFLEKLLSIITSLKTESWTLIYKDLVSFIVGYTNKSSPNLKEIWICIFKALLSPVISGNGTTLSVINDRELILRSLDLLTNHFKISIHSIITSLSESKSKETLKTDIVKKGLLDLKSLLISRDNLRNNTEDPAFIDKLKETEANNAHKNTEDISISKQTDLSKTSHVENTDHVGSNKNQKAYETQTDERFDSTNDPKKINIKKGTQDIRQNNTGDEKTKEEQENNKINHSNYQDEEQLKQQKGITAAKELEKQKITLTDNQDSISLNEPKKFETEQEISEKKKQGDNTKRPLPQSRRFTGIQESETLYIKGSGIVILHYFLSPYFNDLDLLVDGRFKDDTAHQRAVLLLYYLATGKTKVAEFDLTLSKILCGYPLEETLPATLILTKKEKTESKNLLEAIIHHWSPLKNTSVKGLRSAFFERDGKLTKKENGWLLTVEQKTIDVLLGKLPWGYSTIRLPWMQEILNVDWY